MTSEDLKPPGAPWSQNLPQDLAEAHREIVQLRRETADWRRKSESGHLISVEYPVFPRHRDWTQSPFIKRMALRMAAEADKYAATLRVFGDYLPQLSRIAVTQPAADEAPFWANNWLPGLDAVALYAFTVQRRPRLYMEVGSGNSTKFVRQAIRDFHLPTRIISIDPRPRASIDRICDEVIRRPLEEVDPGVFERLGADDILFVDNSHVGFQNSDVTVFFTEILGRLPKGLLYGLHDIFLPQDYPERWKSRFYNEAYFLAVYLFGGADGDEMVLPAHYVTLNPSIGSELNALWLHPDLTGITSHGGAFWLRKN